MRTNYEKNKKMRIMLDVDSAYPVRFIGQEKVQVHVGMKTRTRMINGLYETKRIY